MIQLHGIRYAIGPRILFDDLDWVLGPGDRVALVGPNGAGKTTLLKVLLGEYRPESGNRVIAKGTRLGYLPQEAAEKFDGTVLDRALEAHRATLDMREELDLLHQQLAGIAPEDPNLEALLERSGELQHHLDITDEHSLEPEARRVLSGLGFSTAQQVDVTAGAVAAIHLDPKGQVNINAVPWAEVWWDGRKIGETPIANYTLPLGTQEFVFKNPQFGERRATATIRASEAAAVSVDFSKPPQP